MQVGRAKAKITKSDDDDDDTMRRIDRSCDQIRETGEAV